ncbi:glycosyl transferase [Bacteroidia bacterium]|nr:glycosyl transferase [Bacteroidia bacterium]
MKFLFVVQGEGRGHLTQSIALREMLVRNGHEVVGVMVGKSNRRELPAFFSKNIQTPIYRFESPNFLPVSKDKRTNLWISIAYNVFKSPRYLGSIHYLRRTIKELDVDVVVNFYEMLIGLTYAFFPLNIPYISVAHQYLFLHPDYHFPPENRTELKMLKFFTRITCVKASKLFALSIEQKKHFPERNIVIVPPLLRSEIFETHPQKGNYLHGYLLNANYADEIVDFQKKHPDVFMHFFWDKKEAQEETVINDHLTFHKLNDQLFIRYMESCEAYATTAGFESVCEAMYMGKPVLMVPTHIEQCCNAYEASQAGTGIVADNFDLEALIDYIPKYRENTQFREWAQQSESYWLKEFTFDKEELLKQRLSYKFIFG